MQNANRVYSALVETGGILAGGVPVVVWGLADATVETIELADTDGAGNPGSNNVVIHSFTATAPIIAFPYGIQMKNGASITAGEVTVFYTKI